MYNEQDTAVTVAFSAAGDRREVTLEALQSEAVDFLEFFGEPAFAGKSFCEIIGAGNGETRFKRLLKKAGHPNNAKGFFNELLEQLTQPADERNGTVAVGGIPLPVMMLVSFLEKILPDNRFIRIRDVAHLERLTNIRIPDEERDDMQTVIHRYPVRLSMHVIRQMRVSRNVAYQYMPFKEELDPVGLTNTWIGQFHQGLLEQMYRNRIIFVLNMSCPVYCRFCFRKHKDCRNQAAPTMEDVRNAVTHIRNSPAVKEMVLTGGDPFMNRRTLACAIDELMTVPHIRTLRLATRSIAFYPQIFYAGNGNWLKYLKQKNQEIQSRQKRMEVATHFIHPDEISPYSLDLISDLARNGVAVYVQTPFLKDCNDEGPELTRLFRLLRGAGAEMHYIYIPCSPIQGNSVYWTPISKGHRAGVYLRGHLSDRAIPRICTATPIGKMDWHTSGWAIAPDDDENFIWIRSPYTPEYFKTFAPGSSEHDVVRVNGEGTLDVRYMAKIGDPGLFMGHRPARPVNTAYTNGEILAGLQHRSLEDQRETDSIVPTGTDAVRRVHLTRVEIDPEAGDAALDYIRSDDRITDVVIAGRRDMVDCLRPAGELIRALGDIGHVNAVRLRSLKFNYAPDAYTLGAVDRLAGLNRLTVVNPLRLEIETRFLHSGEFRPEHDILTSVLRQRGITVYASTVLVPEVNNSPEAIQRLAFACRNVGIEFHHVYVAGHPLQEKQNREQPVDILDVIDIGTRVRRDGSGREIPMYILRTSLGEADFGLTTRFYADNGAVLAKLLPYDLPYFQSMKPDFQWPDGITAGDDGCPLVPVPGLGNETGFMVR